MPYLQNWKNIWWDRRPKKGHFWTNGGSGALDEKDFGYVSGRLDNFKRITVGWKDGTLDGLADGQVEGFAVGKSEGDVEGVF